MWRGVRVAVAVCALAAVAALPAAPTSGLCVRVGEDKLQAEGEQLALEVSRFTFRPHDTHNYTCVECDRMKDALQDFCKATHAKSNNLVEDFITACVRDVRPMSDSPNPELRSKCTQFHRFVAELYCPLDPCVQISTEINLAPKSVCGLMHCTTGEDMPGIQGPREPSPPLTCAEYVHRITAACNNHSGDSTGLCASTFDPLFEREGCDEVYPKMASLVAPTDLCSALACDPITMTADVFCREVLHLPAHEMVPVSEYLMYLAKVNATEWVRESNGVQISSATFGADCKHAGADPKDNFLKHARKACQNKTVCHLPHPRTIASLQEWADSKECSEAFDVAYTCVGGGPKHHVFADPDAQYKELTLDCSRELEEYPTPSRAAHPYAFAPTDVGYDFFANPTVDTRNAPFIPSNEDAH